MFYSLLKTLHLLSIIVWIGGMVFAHFFLRPSLATFEPAVRIRLMHEILGRFFGAVTVASALVLATGTWMIGRVAKQTVQAGGSFVMPVEWSIMSVLGVAMILIFGYIRLALFPKLGKASAAADWPAGASVLGKIRIWVGVNLAIGVGVILVALLGRAV